MVYVKDTVSKVYRYDDQCENPDGGLHTTDLKVYYVCSELRQSQRYRVVQIL